MMMHGEFANELDRDVMIAMGVEGGWTECFERLDALPAEAESTARPD